MLTIRKPSLVKHTPAFNSIELLVVITVLMVMLAVILPSRLAMIERANRIRCVSNLRQIAVAVNLYGADFGAYIPFTTATSDWSFLAKPYLDRTGETVYTDPNSRSPVIVCPSRRVVPPNLQPSYAPHRQIMTVYPESAGPRRFGTISRPCDVILMADAIQSAAMPPSDGGWGCYALAFDMPYSWTLNGDPADANESVPVTPDVDGDGNNARYRHDGSANFLFVDGHVSAIYKGNLKQRNVMLNY